MNKALKWITVFFLITDSFFQGTCERIRHQVEHFDRRSIFSLLPLHNEDYVPPIPVHFRNFHNFGRNVPSHHSRPSRSQSKKPELNHKPWIPVQNSQGLGTVRREVFMRPATNRRRFPLKVVVTEQPSSFDIPLRKSIKVSQTSGASPAIQTTGYIREPRLRKIPQPKQTFGPQEIKTDFLREATSPSSLNRTFVQEKWTPKRISSNTPNNKVKNVVKNIAIPKPINTKVDKHLNYMGMTFRKPGVPELASLNNNTNTFTEESDFSKYINSNLKAYDTFFLQPNHNYNFSKNVDVETSNPKYNNANNKDINPSINQGGISENERKNNYFAEIFKNIGVEYAEEIPTTISPFQIEHKIQEKNPKKSITLFVEGKTAGEVAQNKPNQINLAINGTKRSDLGSSNMTNDNLYKPDQIINQRNTSLSNVLVSSGVNNGKLEEYPKPVTHDNTPFGVIPASDITKDFDRTSSTENSNVYVSNEKPLSEIFYDSNVERDNNDSKQKPGAKPVITHEVPLDKISLTDLPHTSHVLPFSKYPFYGKSKENERDSAREIKHDGIYFTPVFPENPLVAKLSPSGNPTQEIGKNSHEEFVLLNTSEKITVTSFSPDKERLVEVSPKRSTWNENKISNENRDIMFNLKKTVLSDDKQRLSHRLPTPPSLITVSPDTSVTVTHTRLNFDSKHHQGNKNSSNNYILERRPSLLPDLPGTNGPRRPNIRLSSAMLAGILIAALIFLGFLTGTVVFAVHQFNFSSSRNKSKERKKKRVTTFTPEYIDETFAGNTYIHNNIFLPNPPSTEDRDSAELDTSFSVDSEETMPIPDQPSTSSNTRSNPIRLTHVKMAGNK